MDSQCDSCGAPLDVMADRVTCRFCGKTTRVTPVPEPIAYAEVVESVPPPMPRRQPPRHQPAPPLPRSDNFALSCLLLLVTKFGIVILLCAGISFLTFKTAQPVAQQDAKTSEAFRLAHKNIAGHVQAKQEVPTDSEGRKLVFRCRDRWHRQLEYKKTGSDSYELRSPGRDRRSNTSDDIVQIRDKLGEKAAPPALKKVETAQQATASLRSLITEQRDIGLQWLEANTPSKPADPDTAKALLNTGQEKHIDAQRLQAICDKWIQVADLPTVDQVLAEKVAAKLNSDLAANVVLKLSSPKNLIQYYNHPNKQIRIRARQAANRDGKLKPQIVDVAISDLRKATHRHNAIDTLKSIGIPESKMPGVKETLLYVFRQRLSSFGAKEFDFARGIVGPKDYKILLTVAENNIFQDDKALELLAEWASPALVDEMAKQLDGSEFKQGDIVDAMTAMGAEFVEPKMLEILKDGSSQHKIGAMKVLANFKTQDALPLLEPLTESSGSFRWEAQRAIKKIKTVD